MIKISDTQVVLFWAIRHRTDPEDWDVKLGLYDLTTKELTQ